MVVKKTLFKVGVLFSCSMLLSSVSFPSVVSAYEIGQIKNFSVTNKINKDELVKDILTDVKTNMLPELELVQPQYQSRGAAGLIATLIAKYGVIYVKKQLPKIIYKHIAKYVGKQIGEAMFVKIFANIVDWGTGAVLEQALARALQSFGINSGIANTVASVVVTVGYWFI
ncbi:hypothetical protein HO640_11670 [Streptococcus suis]|uniref:Uncharacterized protein n=1 Tax=Streptococcus suis TaxID=1307 RepID=A0A0Z8H8C1_STRSU|nr:hypothetical protein [Streptococcus suis]NQH79536.1 hypothetical protein [Streptococcus suis]NQN86206.1 hypothetical protein [Streptococcus suis]CYV12580.1 Uncharacterised protein [Streptococcus suis]HEM3582370.1 hypothetical protein [Streptococcus suis]